MKNIDRQYPIGKFAYQENYTAEELSRNIQRLTDFPQALEQLAGSLTEQQLNQPYREGGWTARQVIHHLADSHMHAYIRCKWTLTEDNPVIKAYDDKAWALTPDNAANPKIAVGLLKNLHARWTFLLAALTQEQLKKFFIHPQTQRQISVEQLIALYAWHGEHHLAHLKLISD
ncbi:MAG: putative metal-dependent hydrolase [Cyclobacteriaceae bacterium]|jgi:hypothetical protein|nr:putative metal-dependent hydrolase [Cyclobacteriaceae bacterium]